MADRACARQRKTGHDREDCCEGRRCKKTQKQTAADDIRELNRYYV
jgi:hypothetical protein